MLFGGGKGQNRGLSAGSKYGGKRHTERAQGEDEEEGKDVDARIVGPLLPGAAGRAFGGVIASRELGEELCGRDRSPGGICVVEGKRSVGTQGPMCPAPRDGCGGLGRAG